MEMEFKPRIWSRVFWYWTEQLQHKGTAAHARLFNIPAINTAGK